MGLEPIQISELLQCVLNLLDAFSFLRARYVRVVGWCGSYSDNGRRGSPGGDAAAELFFLLVTKFHLVMPIGWKLCFRGAERGGALISKPAVALRFTRFPIEPSKLSPPDFQRRGRWQGLVVEFKGCEPRDQWRAGHRPLNPTTDPLRVRRGRRAVSRCRRGQRSHRTDPRGRTPAACIHCLIALPWTGDRDGWKFSK
jgi:hypothetical protein